MEMNGDVPTRSAVDSPPGSEVMALRRNQTHDETFIGPAFTAVIMLFHYFYNTVCHAKVWS